MDYIDKVMVSTNPVEDAINILQIINLKLNQVTELLEAKSNDEVANIANNMLELIKNDICGG